MKRERLVAVLFAAALAACGDGEIAAQGIQLRRPSAVAAFRGIVHGASAPAAGADLPLYLAIANEGRDDISILNAADDTPVLAPVTTRTLVVPVAQRPAILVSASLGDGKDKADLLVAVSAGGSALQLVRTWDAVNEVVDGSTLDVGDDILAAIPLPRPTTAPGTGRIAVALAGARIAVASYVRSADGIGIEPAGFTVSDPLAFQPVALAAVPDDPAHLYAATPDALPDPDGMAVPPVHGVAELDVSGATPTYSGALDARGPTRLVAAALVRERLAGSTATDETAFTGQPAIARVYAVLDENGCGTSERIDCGIAVLDPDGDPGVVPARPPGLLPDVSGRMPYLAPIRLPSPPVAVAVSLPPEEAPTADTTSDDFKYQDTLMRLWPATGALATTAVAAVPCEDGRIYFLDLARWKVANGVNPLVSAGGTAESTSVDATSPAGAGTIRLWVADETGAPLGEDTAEAVKAAITVWPGYTRSENFTVAYQADLPSLTGRRAEVGSDASGMWLAMQVGSAGVQSVRLWDPSFGVQVGDVVAIPVEGLPSSTVSECVGTDVPGAAPGGAKIFEARVAELLQPAAAYPGGAVRLAKEETAPVPDPGDALTLWGACFDQLAAAVAGTVATGLTASIRAGGYVVTSDLSGHLGRPVPGAAGFKLEYPSATGGEDALSCPLVPWPDTIAGTACGAECRSGCEALLLARKSRRSYHLAETCPADDGACVARWTGLTSPDLAGPVVEFRFALQPQPADLPAEPRRGLSLRIGTSSGVTPFVAGSATGQGALAYAKGATAFDRSILDGSKGYRFFVPYAGDFAIDTSPSISGGDPVSIR